MVARLWERFAGRHARPPRRPLLERLEARTVLSGGPLAAPINFAPALNYAEGAAPRAVVAGDFNGDGKPDLAAANEADATVTVRLGNGDGTFGAPFAFGTAAGPAALVTGDFNGDGRLDLAVANSAADSVSLLLGNGDGTFQPRADVAFGAGPVALVAADFDADGKLDLAVANKVANSVSLLLGNGDGTFGAPALFPDASLPTALVAGDLNGTGRIDLAVTDAEANSVVVIPNARLLNPLDQGGSSIYRVGTDPEDVTAADLNGDGRLDLIVANKGSNDVSVLLGGATPPFSAETRVAAGAGPVHVLAADLNRDGLADLAVVLEGGNSVQTLRGCGDGTFLAGLTPGVGALPGGAALSDFDGDGAPDLAVANATSGDASVLLNRSGVVAGFNVFTLPYAPAGGEFTVTVTAVDSSNQTVPTYSGAVHFSGGDPPASFPADYVFSTADAGTRSFSVTLRTSAAQTIRVDDVANPGVSGTETVFVSPGAAASLDLFGLNGAVAGSALNFTATAFDAFGNVATGYAGTVRFSTDDPQAVLPADYAFTAADAGAHTFVVILKTSGPHSLALDDLADPTLSVTLDGLFATPAAAVSFRVDAPPRVVSGDAFDVTVTALDPYGNVDTNYPGTVHFTTTDPAAVLSADYVFTKADAGTHTFAGAALTTPGTQTITAGAGAGRGRVTGGAGLVVLSEPPVDVGLFLSLDSEVLVEGDIADLTGTFTPLDATASYTVTIDWDDGTAPSTVVVAPGANSFRATHVYANNPSGHPQGAYLLRAAVTDGDRGTGSDALSLTVVNAAPVLAPVADQDLAAGTPLDLHGSFADPGADTWTVSVDYGDGTGEDILLTGEQAFPLRHVYRNEGSYDVTLVVTDGDGGSDSEFFTVEVFLPGLTGVRTGTASPGQSTTVVGQDVSGLLERSPHATGGAPLLSLVDYGANPLPVAPDGTGRVVLDASDVRLTHAHPEDRLTLTFAFPAGGDARLDYYDPVTRRLVSAVGSALVPESLTVDPVKRTITIVIDRTSSPAVTGLHGTVFTVSVTQPETKSATVTPSVASAAPSAFSATASFVSTSTRSLTLAPSEDRSLATVRANLSTEGQAAPSAPAGLAVFVPVERPPASGGEETGGSLADAWPLDDDAFSRWRPEWAAPAPRGADAERRWPLGPVEMPPKSPKKSDSDSAKPRESEEGMRESEEEEMPWQSLAVLFVAALHSRRSLDTSEVHDARRRCSGGALRDPRLCDVTPSG